jgi:acyl-CoA synthetase (AMP-forming)/AMP-acid ligase II
MNVGYFLVKSASKYPPKTVLRSEKGNISYKAFNERVNRLAHGLLSLGIQKGDKIATLFSNCQEMCESYFAIIKSGGVLVPLNARLNDRELTGLLTHSDANALIFHAEYSPIVSKMRSSLTNIKYFIEACGKTDSNNLQCESLIQRQPEHEPKIEISEQDDFAIIYTAGTTGKPKGCLLSHRNYIWGVLNGIQDMDIRHEDRNLVVFPMYHTAGLSSFIQRVAMGNTLYLMKSADVKIILETIDREKITSLALVPTLFNALLQFPDLEKYDRSSVRYFVSAGAIFPVELKNQTKKVFPDAIASEIYGMTEEAGLGTRLLPKDVFRKIACVGHAFTHHEVRVVDENGQDVKPGEVGEIIFRGPIVMKGYYKDLEASKEVIKDGWLYSGDIAKVDEEGYIYIVDRKKDIVVSGGINIYPREIEDVLYTHPKIAEVAVIGVQDPKWGETLKAIVVPKKGENLTPEEVITFCTEHLAGYKKPTSVDILDALPKTASGKIQKTVLREKYGKQVRY